jgi:hypothetical protein
VAALAVVALIVGVTVPVWAQDGEEKPVRVSPYAEVLQRIGSSDVKVTYHRPGVKGREIWGTNLVPYGGDPIPWRAGANENTLFWFESDVKLNGQSLEAGWYGFHIIPSETEWILIFSNDTKGWGSFRYKQENDALRITVTPEEAPHEEWLRYGFEDLSETGATAYLRWEKKKVKFKIELE